jgi:hypothetical protein
VAEVGPHEELIANGGAYADMWTSYLGGSGGQEAAKDTETVDNPL